MPKGNLPLSPTTRVRHRLLCRPSCPPSTKWPSERGLLESVCVREHFARGVYEGANSAVVDRIRNRRCSIARIFASAKCCHGSKLSPNQASLVMFTIGRHPMSEHLVNEPGTQVFVADIRGDPVRVYFQRFSEVPWEKWPEFGDHSYNIGKVSPRGRYSPNASKKSCRNGQ